MKQLYHLTLRHTVLFFKDKGRFLTALITPIVLIILYMTFLGTIYHDSLDSIVKYFNVSQNTIDAFVNGYLFSSLLAVSCVTVSFCSNMIMVQDKEDHKIKDLLIAPVSKTKLALSYFISTLLITMIINITALLACFIVLGTSHFVLPLKDVLYCLFDIFLLTLFGASLSSIINYFLTTQGQISAVSSVVSAGYGFLCGAYMPISQFTPAVRTFIKFLPGTYGTSLIRNHLLRSLFLKLGTKVPANVMNEIHQSFDTSFTLMGHTVTQSMMYLIMISACFILTLIYIFLNQSKINM